MFNFNNGSLIKFIRFGSSMRFIEKSNKAVIPGPGAFEIKRDISAKKAFTFGSKYVSGTEDISPGPASYNLYFNY